MNTTTKKKHDAVWLCCKIDQFSVLELSTCVALINRPLMRLPYTNCNAI